MGFFLAAGAPTWGENARSAKGGRSIGDCYQNACKCNRKRVGIVRLRGQKGATRRLQGVRAAPLQAP